LFSSVQLRQPFAASDLELIRKCAKQVARLVNSEGAFYQDVTKDRKIDN